MVAATLRFRVAMANLLATGVLAYCLPAAAQANGVGDRPFAGWSSFSEQTLSGSFLTQANMMAQSDALAASGLQQHGFNYINIDSVTKLHKRPSRGRPVCIAAQRARMASRSAVSGWG
jgi:hypothetical protein